MSNQISRRTLLTAVPASGVALALPTDAQTATPIQRLYEQWLVLWDEVENLSADDQIDRATDRLIALENQMIELPSQCTADLAAKIAAYTRWGDCPELPQPGGLLWEELRMQIARS
ncbi:hypothetical protein [Fluviibacterium sp. S390]|uniref:hypothetical protein n=1 Tax=Fluviibacterium sp. S390 TaxID=3415139 RepID=UPI003C7DF9D1